MILHLYPTTLQISEATVIGVEDQTFGEIVAAIVVLREHASLSTEGIQTHLRARLAPYKLPRIVRVVHSIPKNQLGKVPVVNASSPPHTLHR
jgi:acyl-coenzyme A synthetase/AMP-(fatty) acid ligase